MDWLGIVLSASAMFCLIFPLGYGEGAPNGWKTPYIGGILGAGVVLAVAFIYWQHFIENKLKRSPLMRLGTWKKKNFATLMLVAFCLNGGFGA